MTSDNTGSPRRSEAADAAEALLSARPAGIDQTPVVAQSAGRRKPSLTLVLGGVVAAGALFAGGLLVGNTMGSDDASSASPGDFPRVPGGTSGTSGRPSGAGGFTSGAIASIDGDTLTVKTSDGKTVKVTTSTDTTVTRSEVSDVASLAVGETVTVIGETADGSVTARAITEGSSGIGGGFGGGQPPSDDASAPADD